MVICCKQTRHVLLAVVPTNTITPIYALHVLLIVRLVIPMDVPTVMLVSILSSSVSEYAYPSVFLDRIFLPIVVYARLVSCHALLVLLVPITALHAIKSLPKDFFLISCVFLHVLIIHILILQTHVMLVVRLAYLVLVQLIALLAHLPSFFTQQPTNAYLFVSATLSTYPTPVSNASLPVSHA